MSPAELAKIGMSLGTARQVLNNPVGMKPEIVARARQVVAKWKAAAKKRGK